MRRLIPILALFFLPIASCGVGGLCAWSDPGCLVVGSDSSVNLVVTTVSPTTGPTTGGTLLTLTGQGFLAGSRIALSGIDTVDCNNIQVLSATQATCTTPPHLPGQMSVAVTRPDTQIGSALNAFAFGGDDAWYPIALLGAPSARELQAAVWTGKEMILWGGTPDHSISALADGGRFDPVTNTWTAMPALNAPPARFHHTATWTGSKMVVWGGENGTNPLNTGAVYDRAANTWTAMPLAGAPSARARHSAVWTGKEVLIWGGSPDGSTPLGDGARYDPATNTWAAMNGAAGVSLLGQAAVWTGSEMIVWGGFFSNQGARYLPTGDTWLPLTSSNAPQGRDAFFGIWTGARFIVWGGESGVPSYLDDGGQYDPATDSWMPTSTVNVPNNVSNYAEVWTGTRMVFWGGGNGGAGGYDLGGVYDPLADRWFSTTQTGAPSARLNHSAVWTGSQILIWGGYQGPGGGGGTEFNDGAAYTP